MLWPVPRRCAIGAAVPLARLESCWIGRRNSSGKGRIMTDRNDDELPADQEPTKSQHQDARSGADVREAIINAESGTKAQADHSHPERARTGEAPVEQVFNDPAMTEGQRTVTGSTASPEGVPPGPSPAEAGSGGAQSVVGARESDRLAAGEPPVAGAPFETGGEAEK